MATSSHSTPLDQAARNAPPAAANGHDCCHAEHQHGVEAAPVAGDDHRHHADQAPGTPWPWAQAAANTAFCLLGCSLGDVAVVVASRLWWTTASMASVMLGATIAGLMTSLLLETLWLAARGNRWTRALRMAVGMSLLSMLAMETAMNLVDLGLTGGNRMHLPWTSYAGVLALGEVAGFLIPWPFNAWRLSRGQACH